MKKEWVEKMCIRDRSIAKLELQVATLEGNLELAGAEKNMEMSRAGEDAVRVVEQAVSYTHLDVYKRQLPDSHQRRSLSR